MDQVLVKALADEIKRAIIKSLNMHTEFEEKYKLQIADHIVLLLERSDDEIIRDKDKNNLTGTGNV